MSVNTTAPSVRTLIVSKSIDMAISTRSSRSLCRAIAVGSEEWSEHLQQRVGSFLRDPVAALGNDPGFHVVGNQPHGVGHALTEPFASADGEHGQRQLVLLPLFVLRDGDVNRPIRRKAATERVTARGKAFDVIPPPDDFRAESRWPRAAPEPEGLRVHRTGACRSRGAGPARSNHSPRGSGPIVGRAGSGPRTGASLRTGDALPAPHGPIPLVPDPVQASARRTRSNRAVVRD